MTQNPKFKGHFYITREFRPQFKKFPNCHFETYAQTLAMLKRLKTKPNTQAELSYKLNHDYDSGNCRFLNPSEQGYINKNKYSQLSAYTCHPQIIIYNSKSESTPVRIVVTPDRVFKTSLGPMSFNDNLHKYHLQLNDISRLVLSQNLAICLSACDIHDSFKSLYLSASTAVHALTWAYRDKVSGAPTYVCQNAKNEN